MVLRRASRYSTADKAVTDADVAREEARARIAETMLNDRLLDLSHARATPRELRTSWRERCAELAARPLGQKAHTGDVDRSDAAALHCGPAEGTRLGTRS
jgi:hypothetical protein